MYDKSFIDECLYGVGDIEDIYDYIQYWHTHQMDKSLEEFLGLTDYEYNAWIKNDDNILREILRCRKDNIPFETYRYLSDDEKLAAHSYSIMTEEDYEAAVDYLKESAEEDNNARDKDDPNKTVVFFD